MAATVTALIQIMDLSSNNHPDDQPIDWPAVRDSRAVQAVIVKSTEGGQRGPDGVLRGYANPWAVRDLAGAASVEIPGICYHYARFGSVADELAWFVGNAGVRLARALDFETSTDQAWIEQFCAALMLPSLGYGSAGTYPTTLDAKIRRWIAAWGWIVAPGDAELWQYTNAGSVPGVPGPVDLNLWVGEIADYLALFGTLPMGKIGDTETMIPIQVDWADGRPRPGFVYADGEDKNPTLLVQTTPGGDANDAAHPFGRWEWAAMADGQVTTNGTPPAVAVPGS